MITKILLIVLAVAIIVTAWYFLWYAPAHANDIADGTPCKISGILPGKYKDNKCVAISIVTTTTQVPAGFNGIIETGATTGRG